MNRQELLTQVANEMVQTMSRGLRPYGVTVVITDDLGDDKRLSVCSTSLKKADVLEVLADVHATIESGQHHIDFKRDEPSGAS